MSIKYSHQKQSPLKILYNKNYSILISSHYYKNQTTLIQSYHSSQLKKMRKQSLHSPISALHSQNARSEIIQPSSIFMTHLTSYSRTIIKYNKSPSSLLQMNNNPMSSKPKLNNNCFSANFKQMKSDRLPLQFSLNSFLIILQKWSSKPFWKFWRKEKLIMQMKRSFFRQNLLS